MSDGGASKALNDPSRKRALPSLTALRAFEAVGRTGSLRGAGNELNVSHTVVSRHMRHLQDALGVTLLRAEGRGVVLTAEGAAYHAELARAFAIVQAATDGVRLDRRAKLDVWCVPGILNRRLLPYLPSLMQRLPRHDVNLQPTLAIPRLTSGEADAVVLYGEDDLAATDRRLAAEDIAWPRVFPVASPAFLDRHHVGSLADLAKSPLLHEESTTQWEAWLRLAGLETPLPLGGPRHWHAHIAIEAARLGQGIALANELLVADDLRAGALREPLRSSVRLGAYRVLALADRWDEPGLRNLRRWLRECLGPNPLGAPRTPVAD